MAFRSSTELDSLSEINITPLVDVMLVLLIIFIVTSPMLVQGLQVELPRQAAGPPSTAWGWRRSEWSRCPRRRDERSGERRAGAPIPPRSPLAPGDRRRLRSPPRGGGNALPRALAPPADALAAPRPGAALRGARRSR